MLQVEGKKMSKSLGNFFTVRDLLDQGYAGEVIRFVFLSTHYGKPMDWTDAKAKEAEKTLRKWRALTDGVAAGDIPTEVIDTVAEDLNTAGVITILHRLANAGDAATLKAAAGLLGLLQDDMGAWAVAGDLSAYEAMLSHARQTAMDTKDFSQVDHLKSRFQDAGLEVRMSKTGVELIPSTGFDMAKLDGLL
jgi:cysteinyl-tRNA synthetase